MKLLRLFVIFGGACALILGLYYAGSKKPTASALSENTPIPQSRFAAAPAIKTDQQSNYFDVHGHSAEEIMALLNRAKNTYGQLPSELQAVTRIAMVLHGPDVAYFANENYAEYKSLVDLAAEVDAFGFIDLKVCAASARRQGLQTDTFPPFIELVPYGPPEVRRLESDGYVQF